jgi:AcrR family transcriptional regulator
MPRALPEVKLNSVVVVFITMSSQSISANTPRPARAYRSALRQQQAEETRLRVVAAAGEVFAQNGYARTTFAKIADLAGVSPETVQGNGPKAALLIAAVDYAAFGVTREQNILEIEVGRQFLVADDIDEALEGLIAALSQVHERTAPLALALIGGASSDPELDQYLTRLTASINQQIRRILGVARDRGWLREDIPFDDVVQTAAVISSVDTYLRIKRDGWTIDRYRAWCRRMMAENVFR